MLSISPLDGRYSSKVEELQNYFSEYALIKYRLRVEVEYLLLLAETLELNDRPDEIELRRVYQELTPAQAERVKEIERITNHDVKAVEYYLQERFPQFKRYIHYGLTSQDINTTANVLQLKESWLQVIRPQIQQLNEILRNELIVPYQNTPMLSRTHGQPASPTTLGKEFMVFHERLNNQLLLNDDIPWTTKFGGAVGNFNSLILAHPDIDWGSFADKLVDQRLGGLYRNQYTTQIDHYDNLAIHFDSYRRINTILIDLAQDIWTYISRDYFKLKVIKEEVGSSAMPHKVNPIDFENAEGNLMLAVNLLEFLSRKLPVSRLQRDLTDSTVLRNVGVAMGHTLVAIKSLIKGLNKLSVNLVELDQDLNRNWIVVAEGIQTVLKREGIDDAYEQVKLLTRGSASLSPEEGRRLLTELIEGMSVNYKVKEELLALTPQTYLGSRL